MEHLLELLSRFKFNMSTENLLKNQIEDIFLRYKVPYLREHRLDNKNILDFYTNGIGIEVKIKGTAIATFNQCERYCQFEGVEQLLLITNKAHGMPLEINGKPVQVLHLGKAWL